jgi:hypothetical protein
MACEWHGKSRNATSGGGAGCVGGRIQACALLGTPAHAAPSLCFIAFPNRKAAAAFAML